MMTAQLNNKQSRISPFVERIRTLTFMRWYLSEELISKEVGVPDLGGTGGEQG